MIVEGTQIAPVVENELEKWMLTHRFTVSQAMRHAENLLKGAGQDFALAHRLVDRMTQRLRRSGKIRFERVPGAHKGQPVWSAAS